jgi:O-antigen/teichoic acid export membrane protein
MVSYTQSYFKLYFWQGAALILRFLSVFIVLPFLTKDPEIYGIYSVCISFSMFFGQADLGFLRSAQKYASEYFGKKDLDMELKHVGFGIFILFIFTFLLSFLFIYFSIYPKVIIKGLDSSEEISIVSNLLLILALFAPITVFQRLANMIFEVRLQGYKLQRISLFSSVITILSTFYFFGDQNYQIVSYFLFSQIVYLIVVLISFYLLKKSYDITFFDIIKYVHFDKEIYYESKNLAYSGLYILIFWIFFYELDQIVIGKIFGSEQVAQYSIAFTFITFFRSIFGILYSPFSIRANHFIGMNDNIGLKEFCINVLSITTPIVLLITIAFNIILENFITSWVGIDYKSSIPLARFMILLFTLSPISYLTSIILSAKVRIKELYILATIQPFIYWIGVFLTYSFLGLTSFGAFKFIATLISDLYLLVLFKTFIELSYSSLVKKVLIPILIPLMFLISILVFISPFLPVEKSKFNLFIILITTGVTILISLGLLYFTSFQYRRVINIYLPNKLSLK